MSAEEICERYHQVVRDRGPGVSPADALRGLVHEDIARYHQADFGLARGEFPAQCLRSPALRRFALDARQQQAQAIADAISATAPDVHPVVALAHAAALVSVIQSINDQIGASVLDGADRDAAAGGMRAAADLAFGILSQFPGK